MRKRSLAEWWFPSSENHLIFYPSSLSFPLSPPNPHAKEGSSGELVAGSSGAVGEAVLKRPRAGRGCRPGVGDDDAHGKAAAGARGGMLRARPSHWAARAATTTARLKCGYEASASNDVRASTSKGSAPPTSSGDKEIGLNGALLDKAQNK
nr:uncharacterized protein LOC117835733 [Setaria viridis]